jgi:hypothetical protein
MILTPGAKQLSHMASWNARPAPPTAQPRTPSDRSAISVSLRIRATHMSHDRDEVPNGNSAHG